MYEILEKSFGPADEKFRWQPDGRLKCVYDALDNGLNPILVSALMRKKFETGRWDEPFELCYIQYPHIPIPHAVSTRIGGVSSGAYSSLNIGYTTEDFENCVSENRMRMTCACGIPVHPVLNMTHGTDVIYLDSLPDGLAVGDACMTDKADIPMMITTADCVPVMLYDPEHHAAALAHAGWRGTLMRIAKITVEEMHKKFGSDPKKLKIGIGPSIGPCCFEVGDDIGNLFNAHFKKCAYLQELPLFTGNKPDGAGRGKADLWAANFAALLEAGADAQNICLCRMCSSCRSDMCFSYRRDKRITGRMASLISLDARCH